MKAKDIMCLHNYDKQITNSITSRQELHDEIKIESILEAVIHFDDPKMISLNQNVSLSTHMCNLMLKRMNETRMHLQFWKRLKWKQQYYAVDSHVVHFI